MIMLHSRCLQIINIIMALLIMIKPNQAIILSTLQGSKITYSSNHPEISNGTVSDYAGRVAHLADPSIASTPYIVYTKPIEDEDQGKHIKRLERRRRPLLVDNNRTRIPSRKRRMTMMRAHPARESLVSSKQKEKRSMVNRHEIDNWQVSMTRRRRRVKKVLYVDVDYNSERAHPPKNN